MSGRDLRSFVTSHRADETEKLARRFIDGLGPNKYHAVNYKQLHALTAEKRFSSHKSLIKMQKIEHLSKQGHENNLLKQHRMIWQQEFHHLNRVRKKLQTDIEEHILEHSSTDPCSQLYEDFEYAETRLIRDLEKFRKDTVEPVWNLREDLQFWISENKEELQLGSPEIVERHTEIQQMVNSVKKQQQAVMEKLYSEQTCLEQELRTGFLGELSSAALDHLCPVLNVERGIPEEAMELECPDRQLKVNILQEFLALDERFDNQLELLDDQHARALLDGQYGGWTEDDHFVFVAVCEQYHHNLQNRHMLLFDRLSRHLPKKTRSQLSEHEDFWLDYKYYCEHRRAVMTDWTRARRELLIKARLAFADACKEDEIERSQAEHQEIQRKLCQTLYEKVRLWREQKTEALMLEMQLEEERRQQLKQQRQEEMEKEKQRRNEEKKKIVAHNAEKERKKKSEEEQRQKYLNELKCLLEEQAAIDRERVKFREEQFQQKLEHLQHKKEEKEKEERDRELRMETLREEVRVVAESDPVRMMKDTESWKNRIEEKEDEYRSLQKPLFEINTFSAAKITSDPRFRLEQRLREAGLHNSEYARTAMTALKPLHPPRPDLASDIFNFQ